MAGFIHNNPWSSNPYSAFGSFGAGGVTPGAFGSPLSYQPTMGLVPPHIQQLQQLQQLQQVQQLLQFIPQQIQQLQQTLQFLPQHIAQLVSQSIQGPTVQGSFGYPNPFQAIPTPGSQFSAGQSNYVM